MTSGLHVTIIPETTNPDPLFLQPALRILTSNGNQAGTVLTDNKANWQLQSEPGINLYDLCWALTEFWETTSHRSQYWARTAAERTTTTTTPKQIIIHHNNQQIGALDLTNTNVTLQASPTAPTEPLFRVAATLWALYEQRGEPDTTNNPDTSVIINTPKPSKEPPKQEPAPQGRTPKQWAIIGLFTTAALLLALATPGILQTIR